MASHGRSMYRVCAEACSISVLDGDEPICFHVNGLCVYYCMEGNYEKAFNELLRDAERCIEILKRRKGE